MFLSQMAPQVTTLSPVPAGSIMIPVWLLSAIFALLLMLFCLFLGRRYPKRHRIVNWMALGFGTAALVAISQTHLAGNLVAGTQTALAALAQGMAVVVTVIGVSVFLLDVALLGLSLWLYQRSLNRADTALQIGSGIAVAVFAIILSQSNALASQATTWVLNTGVGAPMRAIMSLLGGPATPTAASSGGSVAVPVWISTLIFAILFMLLFLSLGRRRPKKHKMFNWIALAFATAAGVSASQAPIVGYVIAAVQNGIAASVSGLSAANVQTTSAGIVLILMLVFGILYEVSLRKGGGGRGGGMPGGMEDYGGGGKKNRLQLVSGIAIPVLMVILLQSNTTAMEVSSWLVNTGVGVPMHMAISAAQVV